MAGVLQQELLALREYLGPPCFFVASVVFIILVFVLFLLFLSSFDGGKKNIHKDLKRGGTEYI
jgi:hypothetical protein